MRHILVIALTVVCLGIGSAGTLTAAKPVPASGTSPFDDDCGLTLGADDFFGTGVLFRNSEVEPWVEVNPLYPNIVAGIWQQDRWSNGGSRGNVMAVSYDGGANWPNVVTFPEVTKCTGGPFDRASDPWISFAPNGDLHIMHLVFNIEPPPGKPGGSGPNGMMVQKIPFSAFSDENVTVEEVTLPILIAFDDRGDLHDKNSLTADPTDSNFVYAVWDFLDAPQGANIRPDRAVALGFKGAALFSRSTDGGETWSEPKVLYNPGGVNQTIANQIVVNPKSGRLFNFFVEILNFRNDDKGGKFEANVSMKYSDDKGETWLPRGRPIRIDKIQQTLIRDPDQPGATPPFDRHRTGDIIIDPAVDPTTGALYVVWQDRRFTGRSSIALTMSSDNGRTWSTPIQVNQTPVLRNLNDQAFTPSVHVLPNGTVGVSYYDFRNNEEEGGTDTDYFLVQCQAACSNPASWVVGNETRITVASFDSRLAPVARGYFLGDYVGLDDTATAFAVLYTEGVSQANPTDEFYVTVP